MARPNGKAPKKGKKNRKWGRNASYCKFYRDAGLQERNRARRIRRHLKRYPGDKQAVRALG